MKIKYYTRILNFLNILETKVNHTMSKIFIYLSLLEAKNYHEIIIIYYIN